MRTNTTVGLSLTLCAGLCVCLSLTALAQTQAAETSVLQQTQAEAATPDSTALVITDKEVSAVQAALLGRGYFHTRPNGVLNGQTREALRAWQTDNNLAVSGRIDRATLASLEVSYPATGKEVENARRNGLLPKIGYKTKDGAVTTKNAVVDTSKTVANGAKTGYEKTVDTTKNAALYTKDKTVGAANYTKDKTVGAFTRTKDVSVTVGQNTADGVKTAARKTQGAAQKTSDTLVGRSDLDIHTQVRDVLDTDPEARKFVTSVKNGNVTVKLPAGYQREYGDVIAGIRRVSGVKSVFVVQP